MKLVAATVRLFKNILDSTEVEIESDVTCFVGKNEAGKSAFLNALYRLNPARPNVSFSVRSQYPAWLEKRHRQMGDVLEAVNPVSAVFELEPADLAALRSKFGMDVLTSNRINFSRNYENEWTLDSSSDESAFVAHMVSGSPANEVAVALKGVSTIDSLRETIKAFKASEQDAKVEAAASLEVKLAASVGSTDLDDVIGDILEKRVPKFFYYSEYSSLPSRLKIRELLRADPATLSDDHLTARSLLQLAGTDDQYLLNPDYELRKRELENVANLLTQDVLQYWSQNPELRVNIDVSQETLSEPKPQVVVDELKIRMWDERHWLSLPFDEHSTGFRWFFSFLAAFSQYEWKKEPIIILLDEPGLGLHARAQKDFLKFIDERLAQRGRQVIYTTHSPFMVQPGRLDRTRIVEDRGKEVGSQVTSNVLSTDPDTLFPLQAALGYDIVQHLFIGENNLVVEGTSDVTYLSVMSENMPDGRARLDPRFSIVPVGGVDLVPTFVALLGHHLKITVLIDSRREGAQRLVKMAEDGYLKDKGIVTIGELLDRKLGDIEDLFATTDYLMLFNAAFEKSVKEADLPAGTDSIVNRLARLEKVDRIDHGKPADVFLRRRDELLPKLGRVTVDNFEKLFKRVNQTLGK